MTHKITLIPGDGIGTEVTAAVVRILEATGLKFEWETVLAGADAYEKYKEYIPKEPRQQCAGRPHRRLHEDVRRHCPARLPQRRESLARHHLRGAHGR